MKTLRLLLMVLAAPAAVLLGMHELGGTPISKGYETGFSSHLESSSHLVLSADPEGNMTCWLRLKLPSAMSSIRATTSGNVPLRVTPGIASGKFQWVSVTKDSMVPEDKFEWLSGATVSLDFSGNSTEPIEVADWFLYPNNKSYDSRQRARWRHVLFWASLVLLALAISGGVLEGVDKYREKREPFSPQLCLQKLIHGIDGDNAEESQQMRLTLEKVLVEGATVQEAIAPLRLSPHQAQIFWLKTGGRFRSKLRFLITELDRYLGRL